MFSKHEKSQQISNWKSYDFWLFHVSKKFQKLSLVFTFFFDRPEKIFFGVEKKIEYSFDVKIETFRFMIFSARFEHSNSFIEAIIYLFRQLWGYFCQTGWYTQATVL